MTPPLRAPVKVSIGPNGLRHFGAFQLNLRSRELRHGEISLRLTAQPFEILRVMLERPGEVISREELRRRLWPDGTHVDFDHSLNAAVRRLRAALGDDADCPQFVETLPRRGYRFRGEAGPTPAPPGSLPRLAVLPFTSLSDEKTEENFADGLTEELLAQLVCQSAAFDLVARGSSIFFKRTMQRMRDAGTVLGADYLLEGSVRRAGDRVRIIVRLVHSPSETHRWTDTYEGNYADPLGTQREIAARIADAITWALAQEATRGRLTHDHPSVPPDDATPSGRPGVVAPTLTSSARRMGHFARRLFTRILSLGTVSGRHRRSVMLVGVIVAWGLVLLTLYAWSRAEPSPAGVGQPRRPQYARGAGRGQSAPSPALSWSDDGRIPAHRAHASVRRMPVPRSNAAV